MSPKHILSLSILAAALAASAGGALAADPSGKGPSRAEVKASVLEARAHGQLMPAGEGRSSPRHEPAGTSTLSRRQVRDETLLARGQRPSSFPPAKARRSSSARRHADGARRRQGSHAHGAHEP